MQKLFNNPKAFKDNCYFKILLSIFDHVIGHIAVRIKLNYDYLTVFNYHGWLAVQLLHICNSEKFKQQCNSHVCLLMEIFKTPRKHLNIIKSFILV